jgi:type I restriction enzyme R subunit
MVKRNRTRMNYLEAFQNLIDAYNQGAVNVDIFFDRLNDFVKDLDREEQRTLSEQLSEEELAVFDLLTRPDLDLTDAERDKIKRIARELLDNLKAEKLVLDWRKHQINRASVKHTIQVILDEQLPEKYDADLYYDKVEAIYQHVYESYSGAGGSIYAA